MRCCTTAATLWDLSTYQSSLTIAASDTRKETEIVLATNEYHVSEAA